MNELRLAWSAFRNMLARAVEDPIWAIVALCLFPFRYFKPFFFGLIAILIIAAIIGFGGGLLLDTFGLRDNMIVNFLHGVVLVASACLRSVSPPIR